jgi:Tfp pilus assembly protein PilF
MNLFKPFNGPTSGMIKFLSLILFFVLYQVPQAQAFQSAGHTIRGKVYLGKGDPVSQAVHVRLVAKGTPIAETFTDASGSFTFTNVRNGNYELIADGDGRFNETTSVELEISFNGRMSQFVTCNITLRAKEGADNPGLKMGAGEIDASVPKEARKEYDKGMKSAKSGKSTEAIERFENAIKLHPKYYNAHVALGQEHSKLRNLPAARTAFQQAIEIKPKESEAHLNLGVVLVKTGEFNEAISVLRQTIDLGEKSYTSYLFLGVALMETNSNDEAEKMFLKAFDIGGHVQPGIRLYLANFYNRMGNRQKTLDQLEAYIREAPSASNIEEINKLIKQIKDQKNN